MYFYVSVLYLYTVSFNQALCSMLAAATGPLLLILLNKQWQESKVVTLISCQLN